MTLKRTSFVLLSLAGHGIVLFLLYLWTREPTSPREMSDQPNYEFTPEYSPANFESELETNQAKWESQHITHYQMSLDPAFSSANYGHTPLIIEVKDGKVIAVMDAQGNEVSIEDEQSFAYPDRELFTVPGLFSYAHETFLRKPPTISVHYDPTLGYPDSIFVDPWVEPCCQDFEISVQDFQVLP